MRATLVQVRSTNALQEVYGKLEEPDGLAGLVRLRSGPAQFQDQLLAAEKAGSWSEALALHEQALQHDASSRPTQGMSQHPRAALPQSL